MGLKKRVDNNLRCNSKRSLYKKLDGIFSQYIRLKAAADNGYCQCVTCGNWSHWSQLDCGHFISRAVKAVRFDEMNCAPQCTSCNSFKQGQPHIFRRRLIEMYSKEDVEQLEQKALIGGDETRESLQMQIVEYREKVKQLKKERGYENT